MDLTDAQCNAIRDWARRTPLILAVYLFGSRAKGTSRPDSDVDLALTIAAPNPVAVFLAEGEDWQNELRALTSLLVNLDVLAGDETPNTVRYVADYSLLLFERVS